MKNPFKKSSIIDTVVNVGVGGAANVAIDYAVSAVDALASVDPKWINAGKIALGALVGTMIKNKIARAAADGVAVVGASNLVSSLVAGTDTPAADGAAGIPFGTIGKVRLGNRNFRRGSVRGVNAAPNAFMGK